MNDSSERLHHLLCEKQVTLSLAESATGGALAACITSNPGASVYFLGSIIAYSNQLKIDSLGVSSGTIEKYGAVSAEVVREMVVGIQRLTGSDYAVAVSGIAGPGGATETKPVGTFWGAVVFHEEEPLVWSFQLNGNRGEIIAKSVDILIHKLIEVVDLDSD